MIAVRKLNPAFLMLVIKLVNGTVNNAIKHKRKLWKEWKKGIKSKRTW